MEQSVQIREEHRSDLKEEEQDQQERQHYKAGPQRGKRFHQNETEKGH